MIYYTVNANTYEVSSYINQPKDTKEKVFVSVEDMSLAFFQMMKKDYKLSSDQELFDFLVGSVGCVVDKPERKPKMANRIEKDAVITINQEYEGRPRRNGSKVLELFNLYKDGMTVGDWLAQAKEIGGSMGNLRKDLKVGRITLS